MSQKAYTDIVLFRVNDFSDEILEFLGIPQEVKYNGNYSTMITLNKVMKAFHSCKADEIRALSRLYKYLDESGRDGIIIKIF
jgi:hypothetical protein